MNAELSAAFVAILDRYESGEINADQALVYIQIAVVDSNEN